MNPLEHDTLVAPHHNRLAAANGIIDAELENDPSAVADNGSFATKMAELEASNDKLRVENLALRSRIDGLKSRRSIEGR